MPDHFHALVQLGEATSLTRWVQRLKALATMECHRVAGAPKNIWSRAFHDYGKKTYRLGALCLDNPIRAGLVEDLMCYPYWDASWL
jgi:hypothetical protein